MHIRGLEIIPEPDLILRVKAGEDIGATVKELTEEAVAHYDREVNKNINLLLKGGILEARGETFESPTEYLLREIENPAHAYADIAKFKRSVPRLREITEELELKKERGYEI